MKKLAAMAVLLGAIMLLALPAPARAQNLFTTFEGTVTLPDGTHPGAKFPIKVSGYYWDGSNPATRHFFNLTGQTDAFGHFEVSMPAVDIGLVVWARSQPNSPSWAAVDNGCSTTITEVNQVITLDMSIYPTGGG